VFITQFVAYFVHGFKYFSSRTHYFFSQLDIDCPISRDEKCRDFLFSGGDFLFSADDLLEIEIYYNKKHLFLVELRFLDLSDEKCRDFLFSGGDFLFSADDLLEIEIY